MSGICPEISSMCPVVLVQIVQNYAQWHNLHYAQHVVHQVAQYCESYAQQNVASAQ